MTEVPVSGGEVWRRRARRVQSWVLCRLGRHMYAHRRNPEVGGPDAEYLQCRRCGHERDEYGPPPAASGLG